MDHDPVKAAEAMAKTQAFLGFKIPKSSLSTTEVLGIKPEDRKIREQLNKSCSPITAEQVQAMGTRLVRRQPAAPTSS